MWRKRAPGGPACLPTLSHESDDVADFVHGLFGTGTGALAAVAQPAPATRPAAWSFEAGTSPVYHLRTLTVSGHLIADWSHDGPPIVQVIPAFAAPINGLLLRSLLAQQHTDHSTKLNMIQVSELLDLL